MCYPDCPDAHAVNEGFLMKNNHKGKKKHSSSNSGENAKERM